MTTLGIERGLRAGMSHLVALGVIAPQAAEHYCARNEGDAGDAAPTRPNEVQLQGPIIDEETGLIYDFFGVPYTSAARFRESMDAVEGDVLVRINSPGGFTWEGAGVRQAVVERRNAGDRVDGLIDGLAASAATFALGDFNDVGITRMSEVYVHRVMGSKSGYGEEMVEAGNRTIANTKSLEALYTYVDLVAAKTRSVADLLRGPTGNGTWFTDEDSVSVGFASHIPDVEAESAASTTDGVNIASDELMHPPSDATMMSVRMRAQMLRDAKRRAEMQTFTTKLQIDAARSQVDKASEPVLAFVDELSAKEDSGEGLNDTERKWLAATKPVIDKLDDWYKDIEKDENSILAGRTESETHWQEVDSLLGRFKAGGFQSLDAGEQREFIDGRGNLKLDFPLTDGIGQLREMSDGQKYLLDAPRDYRTGKQMNVQLEPGGGGWGTSDAGELFEILKSTGAMRRFSDVMTVDTGRAFIIHQLSTLLKGVGITGLVHTGNATTRNDDDFDASIELKPADCIFASRKAGLSLGQIEDGTLPVEGTLDRRLTEQIARAQEQGYTDSIIANTNTQPIKAVALANRTEDDGVGNRTYAALTGQDIIDRLSGLRAAVASEYLADGRGVWQMHETFFWNVIWAKLRGTDDLRSLIQLHETGITGEVIERLMGRPIIFNNEFAETTAAGVADPNKMVVLFGSGRHYRIADVNGLRVNRQTEGLAGDNYQITLRYFHRSDSGSVGPFGERQVSCLRDVADAGLVMWSHPSSRLKTTLVQVRETTDSDGRLQSAIRAADALVESILRYDLVDKEVVYRTAEPGADDTVKIERLNVREAVLGETGVFAVRKLVADLLTSVQSDLSNIVNEGQATQFSGLIDTEIARANSALTLRDLAPVATEAHDIIERLAAINTRYDLSDEIATSTSYTTAITSMRALLAPKRIRTYSSNAYTGSFTLLDPPDAGWALDLDAPTTGVRVGRSDTDDPYEQLEWRLVVGADEVPEEVMLVAKEVVFNLFYDPAGLERGAMMMRARLLLARYIKRL